MKVTILNCGSGDWNKYVWNPRKSTVKDLPVDVIIDMAVTRFWGSRAFFWQDNGLKDQGIFGQVCKPVSPKFGGGNTCITGRVRIDIEE